MKTLSLKLLLIFLVAVVCTEAMATTISGNISYTGTSTGIITVALFAITDTTLRGEPTAGDILNFPGYYFTLDSLCSYTITGGLPDGIYYIASTIKPYSSDDYLSGKVYKLLTYPWGVYGTTLENLTPVTITGNSSISGIDITLVDGTENPNPFYKKYISTKQTTQLDYDEFDQAPEKQGFFFLFRFDVVPPLSTKSQFIYFTDSTETYTHEFQTGFGGGLFMGFGLSRWSTVYGGFEFSIHKIESSLYNNGSFLNFEIGLRLLIPSNSFSPYAAFALGSHGISIDYHEERDGTIYLYGGQSQSAFGISLGLGFRLENFLEFGYTYSRTSFSRLNISTVSVHRIGLGLAMTLESLMEM